MLNQSKKLNALVIDDEMSGRTMIEFYINEYLSDNIGEVVSVDSINSAINTLLNFQPDIIFCDYELRGEEGLMITKLVPKHIPVVVITAHSQYAINAIRASVFDYILKPIEENEFLKFKTRLLEKFKQELTIPDENSSFDESLIIKESGENIIIKYSDILYVEASGAYAKVVTENRVYLLSKTLKTLELSLPKDFLRAHRSFLVPKWQINSFNSTQVCLKNGKSISLSKTGRKLLLESL
jgi:two-component system LytT family response regulator